MSYFLSSEAIAIAMAMGSVVNKIPMQEGPLVGRAGCILEGRASEEGKKEGGGKKERKRTEDGCRRETNGYTLYVHPGVL